MAAGDSVRNLGSFPIPYWALLILLAVLTFLSLLAQNSHPPLAIWEVPGPKASLMLSTVPASDSARYIQLRNYFTEFGCTPDRMSEEPLGGRQDKHRNSEAAGAPGNGNLLCTLPGRNAEEIVVAAWYSKRERYGGVSNGWAEAVMLPILYHALPAQPRHFTFLFAEIDGREGEHRFFERLHQPPSKEPFALVALDALGLGAPRFFSASPRAVPNRRRPAAETIDSEARRVSRLQGIAIPQMLLDSSIPPLNPVFPSPLLSDAKDVPRILIYSNFALSISSAAFRQDHDFVAFYLGDIDQQLDPMTQTIE